MYWPRVFSWVDRLGKQNFWVRPRERFSELRKYRAGVSFYDYFGVDPTTSSFPLKFIRFPLKIIALRTNTPNLTSGRKKIFKWGRNGFLLIFERKLSKEFDLADLLFVLALVVSGGKFHELCYKDWALFIFHPYTAVHCSTTTTYVWTFL